MNIRFKIILFGLIGFVSSIYSQKKELNILQKGINFYNNRDFVDALAYFKEEHKKDTGNAEIDYWLAKCYEETSEKEKVLLYYVKSYNRNPKAFADILYEIGHANQVNYKFDEAEKYFKLYKKELKEEMAKSIGSTLMKEQMKVAKRLNECENGKVIYANYFKHKIKNIGGVVNTLYPEYTPVISSDNKTLMFTSRRPGGQSDKKDKDNLFFEDVWMSVHDANGNWSKPVNLGIPVNSEGHDACIGLSPNGKELFMYISINGGDIYVSQFVNGAWTKPNDEIQILNSKGKEPSVTISANGKTIFFSSDKPGGYGGLDIYRIDMGKDGKWSEPMNLGSVINSEYDEDSPFLATDGKKLYFSSNGHNNMGGYDIFSSKYDTKTKNWSKPVNLGYPINSPNDDIYFVITGNQKTAYYASAKKNGFGDKDIYEIDLDTAYMAHPLYVVPMGLKAPANYLTIKPGHPDFMAEKDSDVPKEVFEEMKLASVATNTSLYTGVIMDEKTNEPLECVITVKKINLIDPPKQYQTDKEGNFEIPLSHGFKYAIDVEKDGFMFASNNIDLTKPEKPKQLIKESIPLKKPEKGLKLVMKNIVYEVGNASLKPESFVEVDILYDFLVKNPTVKIEISGHTDNIGSPQVNKELSLGRARAIYKLLVKKGIDGERIKFVGYGSERPIAANNTPEGRSKNRRTEFEIIQ